MSGDAARGPELETELQRFTEPLAVRRTQPRLEWFDGQGAHTVTLTGPTLVGSAPGAGLVLDDPTVSRLHAEITPRDDGVWIRDLASRNGTYVENVRVVEARIPDGGRIRLGETELEVLYEAAPSPVELWPHDRFGALVGASAAMRELFATLARLAAADAPVLVSGETGTGKELVARALHDASPRAEGPFVVVDCAALAENLVEAELFGHARGAFTGALAARAGALESASGGTVFLDEIGELPPSMQPKLLRALESRTVRRLGETGQRPIDVRFVAATHRDLRGMVAVGAFREDLFFRLAVLPIVVPPLRARLEDVPLLAEHFLARAGAPARLPPDVAAELSRRPWLGNVRELRNFVDRLRTLGAAAALSIDPPERPREADVRPAPEPEGDAAVEVAGRVDYAQPFKVYREQLLELGERRYVEQLLARHGRQVAAAAREAGVARTYLYRLMRRYGL